MDQQPSASPAVPEPPYRLDPPTEEEINELGECAFDAPAAVPEPQPDPQEPWTALDGSLTIRFLQYINHKRAERWHGLNSWSALEWAGAMAGEAGEACNAAKKLKRIEDHIANINLEDGRSLTDRQTASAKIVDEIADTVIYGVLLASRVGMDLEEAIRMKFNRKSEEYGFPERIPANSAAALAPRTASQTDLMSRWPVMEALKRLADAADHFLHVHDCDHHGHEGVLYAMQAARLHIAALQSAPRTASPQPELWDRVAHRYHIDQRDIDWISLRHSASPRTAPAPQPDELEQLQAAMRVKDAALKEIMVIAVPAIADAAIVGASYGPNDVVEVVRHLVTALRQPRTAPAPSAEPPKE